MKLRFPATFLLIAIIAASCSSDSSTACAFAASDVVESILGDTTVETLSVERLDECIFTAVDAPDQEIAVRIETVPDAQIFLEHAIEGTDPGRVQTLDLGEGSVLFEDEAVLGRMGDRVALITGTVPTDELVEVLSTTLDLLDS